MMLDYCYGHHVENSAIVAVLTISQPTSPQLLIDLHDTSVGEVATCIQGVRQIRHAASHS